MEEEIEKVRRHMKLHYRVDLDDLKISNVPGYWRDKKPKIHPGHPLHSCVGCAGSFCATYTYYDNQRDHTTGKFVSPYRTWRKIYNQSVKPTENSVADLNVRDKNNDRV